MRRAANRPGIWLLLMLAALLLRCPSVHAVPLLVNYQGTVDLTTPAVMTVEMEFRVYGKLTPADANDSFLWGKRYEVRIDHGKFNVIIGSEGLPDVVRGLSDEDAAAADLGDALAHAPCKLGICVIKDGKGEKQELTPRQEFPVAPHAVAAQRVLGNQAPETIGPPRYGIGTCRSDMTKMPDVTIPVRPNALVRIEYYANIVYYYAGFQLAVYTQDSTGGWSATPALLEPLIGSVGTNTENGQKSGTSLAVITGTRMFAPPQGTTFVRVHFIVNPKQELVDREGYDEQFVTVEEVLNGTITP